jgi:hypothetical protein
MFLANWARSTVTLLGAATEKAEIAPTRRRTADRETRHVYPHSVQVRPYSFACHGSRNRSPSLPSPDRAHLKAHGLASAELAALLGVWSASLTDLRFDIAAVP